MRFHLAARVIAAIAQLAAWPIYLLAATITPRTDTPAKEDK